MKAKELGLRQNSVKSEWELMDRDIRLNWETWRLSVPGGWLYKTIDLFNVEDEDGDIKFSDSKVTVTFVPSC